MQSEFNNKKQISSKIERKKEYGRINELLSKFTYFVECLLFALLMTFYLDILNLSKIKLYLTVCTFRAMKKHFFTKESLLPNNIFM